MTYSTPEWEVDVEGNYRYLGSDALTNSVPSGVIPETSNVRVGSVAPAG